MLITGVGTGGHITGCAEVLKKAWPKLKVFAVEPTLSPVISGGQPGPHPIQGIGAGFIPTNLHTELLDGVIQVEADDAKEMARRCAREEGMLVGISSGATLAAIAQKLPRSARGTPRARLQLRHRRALPVGAGLPAGGVSAEDSYSSLSPFSPIRLPVGKLRVYRSPEREAHGAYTRFNRHPGLGHEEEKPCRKHG